MTDTQVSTPCSVTEIQVLSLFQNIGCISSAAESALIAGLEATKKNASCLSLYWMRQDEDSSKIVITAQWSKFFDSRISRAYLAELMPHLKSPPLPSIRVDHSLHPMKRNAIGNYINAYFPATVCTEYFQDNLQNQIQRFAANWVPTSRHHGIENMEFVTSGWSIGTQRINSIYSKSFVIYMIWKRRKSEVLFKEEDPFWGVLLENIAALGAHRIEEYHGRLHYFTKETSKVVGLSDKSDKKEDFMNESVISNSVESFSSITKLQETLVKPSHQIGDPYCTPPPQFKFPSIAAERSWKTDGSDTDDSGSLVLTPSSSCISLDSLYHSFVVGKELKDISDFDPIPITNCEGHYDVLQNGTETVLEGILSEEKFEFNNTSYDPERGDLGLVAPITELTEFSHKPEHRNIDIVDSNASLWNGNNIKAEVSEYQSLSWLETHLTSKYSLPQGHQSDVAKPHRLSMTSPERLEPASTVQATPSHLASAPQTRWSPEQEVKDAKSRFRKYKKPIESDIKQTSYPTQGWRSLPVPSTLPWWKRLATKSYTQGEKEDVNVRFRMPGSFDN